MELFNRGRAKSETIELGYLVGEKCNRDKCTGTIVEHSSDGGCSCHISPPCLYCVTSREYCSECDWDAREEEIIEDSKIVKSEYAPPVYKQKTFEDLDRTKIDWMSNGGWHSGMRVKGIYPEGTKREDILKALNCESHVCMAILSMHKGVFNCSWFTD